MNHAYGDKFMSYADKSSRIAANTISQLLRSQFEINSVLDVGCAKGTWLDAWRGSGSTEVLGVDGEYVNRDELVIPPDCFVAADLKEPLQLAQRFDLVQSLEVAEHLPASAAENFVANLIRHSKGLVLFSAAPPGQGGEFHINEQPYDYWRAIFRKHGFHAHDWIRPQISKTADISFWYRYNIFLYINAALVPPASVANTRVPDTAPLSDISPGLFRLRKSVVRLLPEKVRDGLAHFKSNLFPSGRW